MTERVLDGPKVTRDRIVFSFPDQDRTLAAVRLYQEVSRPRSGPEMTYDAGEGVWKVEFPRPDAARMEYLIEIAHPDGSTEMVTDPTNPLRAAGPFGDKSVVEMDGYSAPDWLEHPRAGTSRNIEVRCRPAGRRLPAIIWDPEGLEPDEPAPLLIVHDGPEYAGLSSLTRFLQWCIDSGALPAHRAALLPPVERDQMYSASASYARSLTHEIVPDILAAAPISPGRNMRIGMGASLGALAMLHAHRKNPATFGGLFLQSGSYFRMRFDKQESGFVRFRRISRFVGEVLTTQEWAHPIPVMMTCGSIEENLANNRAVAHALRKQGYDVTFYKNPDGHNWIGWRDTFEPHLREHLARLWT
ncbi:MAG: alpha/beta hydrolase [Actinomycetota bacterium]